MKQDPKPGMDLIQIDNAIPKLYQDQIELETTSREMAWTFHEESARSGQNFQQSFSGFSHIAFHHTDPTPTLMSSTLIPMLFIFCEKAKIELNSILRIRLGLFIRTMIEAPHHNPHVDFFEPHYDALYYVNDSDGDTVIFNETLDDVHQDRSEAYANENKFTIAHRISPKKGRMVCFDGRRYHASMHPMKSASRVVITFNFR
jgi:hypothetical protein